MGKFTYNVTKIDGYGSFELSSKDKRIATIYYNRYFVIHEISSGIHYRHIFNFLSSLRFPTDLNYNKLYENKLVYDMVSGQYLLELPSINIK